MMRTQDFPGYEKHTCPQGDRCKITITETTVVTYDIVRVDDEMLGVMTEQKIYVNGGDVHDRCYLNSTCGHISESPGWYVMVEEN